jgi:hypothetical protein
MGEVVIVVGGLLVIGLVVSSIVRGRSRPRDGQVRTQPPRQRRSSGSAGGHGDGGPDGGDGNGGGGDGGGGD